MKIIEVSFVSRRKEKLTVDAISLTDAPGWVVLKSEGDVTEMIPASVVKRLRVIPADAPETPEPVLLEDRQMTMPPQQLRLPSRRVIPQSHLYTPLVRQHA